MISDTTALSALTLGTIVNALGLAIPLIIFAAELHGCKELYFRYWAASYLLMLLALLGDVVVQPLGYPLGASFGIFTVYALASAAMTLTATELMGRAPSPFLLALTTCGTVAGSAGLLAAGYPFPMAATPVVLFNMAGHLLVGVAILQSWRAGGGRLGGLLGVWMIVTGLWALAFPVLDRWHVTWVGYVIAGVNHTVVGTGMAVFLLEVAAAHLRRQHEQVQALSRVKTDFIATVSHELRTPLTVVKTAAWMLKRKIVARQDPYECAIVEDLSSHTESLIELVDNLLDFSKFELGKLELELASCDLADLVREAEVRYLPMFEAKQIRLEVQAPDDLEIVVDVMKIRQVIANVLTNAAKFTPTGGRVWVKVERDGDAVRIEVGDTGAGIPAELLQKVFTKFYQVDGSATRRVGGLGLGLSLCKVIVEDGHGGRIWAERLEAGGSLITIRLPLMPASYHPLTSVLPIGA